MSQTARPIDARSLARNLFVERMSEHFERLDWTTETLRERQTSRLRELLTTAISGSPYHARRLHGIDPARFELEDLPTLPAMTKPDMMANFDDVPTDRRISLASAAAHLATAGPEPTLLLDEYIVLASGGSSGTRGMFAFRYDEFAEFNSAVLRTGLKRVAAAMGWPLPAPLPLALVAAPNSMHATRAAALVLEGIAVPHFAPATLPFDEIARRVAEADPAVLAGYASTLARLADRQAQGGLAIHPQMIITTSEQLTPELAGRIARGFGMPPANSFASSEGLIGSAPPGSDVFTFASDLAIIEFVDEDDRPIAPGQTSHHVLVTNLFNRTQPLIRYRLDDQMTAVAGETGSAHQHATLSGRTDDYLVFDGVVVHPLTIRSAVLRHSAVAEYQVTSSPKALHIDVATTDAAVLATLEGDIAAALRDAGAGDVAVTCARVEHLERDSSSGKVRLFRTA